MELRKAKLEDCNEVYELCRVKGLVNPSGEPPKRWWIEAFVREKQIFFVAEENGRVIGFALGERTTGDIAIFHMLAINEAYRGKGIGQRLMDLFEEEAKKRKLKVILTYGYANNKVVDHILKKRNYEKGSKYYEYLKWISLQ